MTKGQINSPKEARLLIFTKIRECLNNEVLTAFKDIKSGDDITVNQLIPYIEDECEGAIHASRMQFSCTFGEVEFRYSITINLGEIRLAIFIQNDSRGTPVLFMDNVDAYEYKSPYSPLKTTLLVDDVLMLEHVFNNRFAEPEIMFKVLSVKSQDDNFISVLADAIAIELLHINHSLMKILTNKWDLGFSTGIYDSSESRLKLSNASVEGRK